MTQAGNADDGGSVEVPVPTHQHRRPWLPWLAAAAALVLVATAAVLMPRAAPTPLAEPAPPSPASPEQAFIDSDRPLEAALMFAAPRVAEGADVPGHRYVEARAVVQRMLAANPDVKPTADRRWEWIGPGNVGGRVRALVIDPRNPEVMFAGAATGGIWKTTDAGRSWTPLTDTLSNLAIFTLVADPTDPDVMYAGTGEQVPVSVYRGDGIMRTTDGGRSWAFLPSTQRNPNFHFVRGLHVSGNDPKRLYALTSTGVWRSGDAGSSWEQVFSGRAREGCGDLAVTTDREPDVLYVACGEFTHDGVYRSVDGGTTWEPVLPSVRGAPYGQTVLAIAPSDQDVVYAAVGPSFDEGSISSPVILRSREGGASGTWQVRNVANGRPGSPYWTSYYCRPDFGGPYTIAVDPTDPDRIWTGAIDLFRSDDGGKTLTIASYWYLDYYIAEPDGTPYVHADHIAITFHPDYDGRRNKTVYFGNDGGVFVTHDDRAPLPNHECLPQSQDLSAYNQVVYEGLNHGLGVTQIYEGAVSADGSLIVIGTQDNGTQYLREGEGTEGWRPAFGGDGGYGAIDPETGAVYTTGVALPQIQVYRSAGPDPDPNTFVDVTGAIDEGGEGVFFPPLAMDPNRPEVLWIGGNRMWRTTDSARSWRPASPDLFGRGITAIAISRQSPNIVYVGLASGEVYKSENALSEDPTWRDVTGPMPRSWVSAIAIDPQDRHTVYVAHSRFDVGHVWKTTDSGRSWTNVDGTGTRGLPNIPVMSIALHPNRSGTVFVGTDLGVFGSADGGRTWAVSSEGLASTIVDDLEFRAGSTELYAFTFGRGVYRISLR